MSLGNIQNGGLPLFGAAALVLSSTLVSATGYLTFHGDRQRTGWLSQEVILTPQAVSSGNFGPVWNSDPFDTITINGKQYPPHLYASPLYADQVTVSSGAFSGQTFNLVIAATNNGFVYAVNATATTSVPAGRIVWRKQLTNPEIVGALDGGLPLGVLGTPIIDAASSPARIYLASDDAQNGWQVFAIDLTSGNVLPGWPVAINSGTLEPVNRNGPARFQASSSMSQRGALNLSPGNNTLYVPFGGYDDAGAGYMAAIDTTAARIVSAFSGAPDSRPTANGGMWASAGAAIDANGTVYATTGNGTTGNAASPGYWSQSVLAWGPGTPLSLSGTYTPFNYCAMDQYDTDLAGGAPIVVPDLGIANTSTPRLLAFGGKQGNMYLLDRDHLPGNLAVRQGCSTVSGTDRSLLPPGGQAQFAGARGPLNIFGPYSENYTNTDWAKSRSTPAYFRAADGTSYLFATGSTKQAVNSQTTVPPCVVRLKIVTSPGQPAFLATDRIQNSITMLSPGSAVVTSNGSAGAIVWVLVGNVPRGINLLDPNVAHPILYAFDTDLNILWNSTQVQLNAGAKYMIPAFGHGQVFAGTDRIQAFGLKSASTGGNGPVAIDAGGTAAGNFLSDRFYVGGNATVFGGTVNTAGVINPAPQAVYQSKRTGGNGVGFSYVVPNLTPNAPYTVRLHFADDLSTGPGKRVFDVAINGNSVLASFDIFSNTGAQLVALVREFPIVADASGTITIAYTYNSAGNPLASGIEVIPATPAVRINSGGAAAGNYLADTWVTGGNSTAFSGAIDISGVINPAPQAVYLTKRTGDGNSPGFTYTVPNLTPGYTYTVRLHFVESLWTAPNLRLFNVGVNGAAVLTGFDIFAAAGAPFKAVVKEFKVAASPAGIITVAYTYGSIGNPLSSGIEIVP